MPVRSVPLQSLVCHSAVDMARRGFASLIHCSDRPIEFVVHDDGSMESQDCDRLCETIGPFRLIDRRTADEVVEPVLAAFPRCLEFRRRSPLALKLFDVPLMSADGEVAYCDTDVLAFHPFSGLFDWPGPETTAVFMTDTQNAYAIRPWHLIGSGRIRLPERVNTGLIRFRTSHHDLEFIEWLLAREFNVYHRIPQWVEQTCWAALGNRGQWRLYDDSQVRVIRSDECLTDPALTIGHFTADVRYLWERAPDGATESTDCIRVRTTLSGCLTASTLTAEQMIRVGRRGWKWIQQVV